MLFSDYRGEHLRQNEGLCRSKMGFRHLGNSRKHECSDLEAAGEFEGGWLIAEPIRNMCPIIESGGTFQKRN